MNYSKKIKNIIVGLFCILNIFVFQVNAEKNEIKCVENMDYLITQEIINNSVSEVNNDGVWKSDNCFLTVLDASTFKVSDDFYTTIGKNFEFGETWFENQRIRSYNLWFDHMHMIDNIPQGKILLFIKNLRCFSPIEIFNEAFSVSQHDIIISFEKYILPFWSEDHFPVKKKNFCVYYN